MSDGNGRQEEMVVEQATDARPACAAEDEANSMPSNDEGGSSEDDTAHMGPASAGSKRKRTTPKYQKTSCELCKARKVNCVYLERQKPGSRIGFTLELESKVNRVDALLQTLWRRVEDHIAHDHVHSLHHPPRPQTLSPAISSSNDGLLPPPSDLVRAQLRPSATPLSHASFSSPSWRGPDSHHEGLAASSSAGPRPLACTTNPPLMVPGTDATPSLLRHSSLLPGGPDLPPHDMVYTLVDLYFKHCNTWCPILDRKSTFGALFGSTSLVEVDRILLHAIVATTLRFLHDPRLTPDARTRQHAVSKQVIMTYATEHVNIAALKALVILALDELGTSNGPRGWNLLSLLAQNVRHLGLCNETRTYLSAAPQDLPHTASTRRVAVGPPESWIEDEGRRRLCWMVYLLDRYATVATTFDFSLDDRAMRRLLPCSYDLFSRNVPVETRSVHLCDQDCQQRIDRPENLGSFSHHCEMLRILSRVHNFLKVPIDHSTAMGMTGWRRTYRSLDAALDSWLQGLPSEYSRISALCHSDPASRVANWFMLHSAYVTSVVRLHSAAAYPSVRSPLMPPSHYAMQRCLSAVQSLRDITQDVYEANGLDLLGPPFAFALWVAARLLVVHAAAVGCPVDGKVDFFIDMLSYVGQYWEVAKKYARILARVVERGRQGDMTSFSTMRREAYDLVNVSAESRQSVLEEPLCKAVALSELDGIDVFDFFNYPKVTGLGAQSQAGPMVQPQGLPDAESDWLGYGSSFD
ncbi:hypothetical protein CDD81_639 [Ophiocordyceps australis]|uniref:Xylanolytic transcriptional activator regulatory domain-containing protein n=1 Tax=Ophiocordyceps australis TaxID=1399860 RepID=A0A2C5Y2Z6_9HYPO|nr:hypothetical protein CDD81_639 [Ophiocordyceps australis]